LSTVALADPPQIGQADPVIGSGARGAVLGVHPAVIAFPDYEAPVKKNPIWHLYGRTGSVARAAHEKAAKKASPHA
jgi:hypothetical protein